MSAAEPHLSPAFPPRVSPFKMWWNTRGPHAPHFFARLNREFGDVVNLPFGELDVVLIGHPELAREFLLGHSRSWQKSRALQLTRHVLGDGLLTSEEPFHLKQRRLIQPAFLPARLRAYADEMVGCTERFLRSWSDGKNVDMAREMSRLTLNIVGQTLFRGEVGDEAARISRAMDRAMSSLDAMMTPVAPLLAKTGIFRRRIRAQRAVIDEVVFALIHAQREDEKYENNTGKEADLLRLLLDTRYEDGSAMSDAQIRDEAVTLFLAGHETTANALAWTWFLLAQHPEVAERLHAEAQEVLGVRAPTYEDAAKLVYTRQVLSETMRLYPPAWALGRQVIEDIVLEQGDGKQQIRAGSTVLICPFAIQRDPRFWSEPERFDPDRFAPEREAERARFTYLPFGAGTRACIGEGFAWLEMTLALAMLARDWRAELRRGAKVSWQPSITLRPVPGIPMQLKKW